MLVSAVQGPTRQAWARSPFQFVHVSIIIESMVDVKALVLEFFKELEKMTGGDVKLDVDSQVRLSTGAFE